MSKSSMILETFLFAYEPKPNLQVQKHTLSIQPKEDDDVDEHNFHTMCHINDKCWFYRQIAVRIKFLLSSFT
ncbi:hypothetical protein CR513_52793, partial [Mucuna pruriens]